MNTYKDPQYRGYYLGKVAVALVLLVVIVVAVTRYPGLTTAPAAPPETPVVQSAQLSPDGIVTVSGVASPGSTVNLYAGDVMLGSVVAGPDGSWSYEGPLAPGDYQFVARTVDETGRTVAESAVLSVSLAEATASPVAEASGTSAIVAGAPSPAQASATEAAATAGSATPPAVESPAPVAVATAAPTNLATSVGPIAGTATAPPVEGPAAVAVASAAPTSPAISAASTTIATATAPAESAAASSGLAISRVVVSETGQVTLLGTGEPSARIEIVLDGEVVDRVEVKGDGTWSYTYQAIAGVQNVAVQYLGEPDSRTPSRTFESTGTTSSAAVTTGTPTPTSPSAVPSQEPTPTSAVAAQAGAGQAYIVQEGDYLRKLALQFYGDETEWPLIYDGTNAMAARDPSFTVISDPNLIMPGWKLWIPAK
jgi:nucleoid-associated protein YgaU